MNFRNILLIVLMFVLSACNQFEKNKKNIAYISDQKYSNTGFALIYDDVLKKKRKYPKK